MKLQIVPARTGMLWVRQGLQLFWRRPLALTALFFMGFAALSLVSLLPLVGPVLMYALTPAFGLALMVAAGQAMQGQRPQPLALLAAFRGARERRRAQLLLGALYAAGLLAILGLSALLDQGRFARLCLGLSDDLEMQGLFSDPAMQSALLLVMLLQLPLLLLFWHAPALVYWHGAAPAQALFFSAVACLRNAGAFLVYGLGWCAVFLLGILLVSLAVGLLMGTGLIAANAAGGVLMAALLLLLAMLCASTVLSFRDCFAAPQAAGD